MGRPQEEKHDIEVEVLEKPPELDEPGRYHVILHNDHYTTMEFVVEILKKYFHKLGEQAVAIMLKVHQDGRGVAGTYSYDIAETKAAQVVDEARTRGYPLKCTVEPEGGQPGQES